VVKLGGATLGSHDTAMEDMVELQQQGKSLVVVHGGGKLITEWLTKQGISSSFVQGERVTDQATLEVVISVLAGLVNKEMVATINGLGGQAVGVSGVDGTLIEGRIRDKEMGYVGAVAKGSGMIHPELATMFCFLTTDATVELDFLSSALRKAVDASFNMISVDLRALSNTLTTCIIDGRQPHALLREIEGEGGGTTIGVQK